MSTMRKNCGTKPGKAQQTCFIVAEQTELLRFLLEQMKGESRNNIKSLLAHGQILVDNEVISQFDQQLKIGQQVVVHWSKVREESQPQGLKILFEDPYVMVIEKEAGLLSIATVQERGQTAYSILSEHVKKGDPKSRIFVVHRLDRETSGVMMFAKSKEIQQALQNAWKEVVLKRSYVVVVEGLVNQEEGTITSWLKENKSFRMYSSRTPNDGQKSVTHYRVLKHNKNYSLLEVELETGRKNQIRVHMQDLGHSVIGDKKYGGSKSPIGRLGLHAQVLTFLHPVTKERMHFDTDIPMEFLRLFN